LHLVLGKKENASRPEAIVLIKGLSPVIGMLTGTGKVLRVGRRVSHVWSLDVHLDFRVAAEPRLLRIENTRELQIDPRGNRPRRTAAADTTSTATIAATLCVAGDHARCPDLHWLECPDGAPVLVAHVSRCRSRHRLIETGLDGNGGERRLGGRHISVQRLFLSRFVKCYDPLRLLTV